MPPNEVPGTSTHPVGRLGHILQCLVGGLTTCGSALPVWVCLPRGFMNPCESLVNPRESFTTRCESESNRFAQLQLAFENDGFECGRRWMDFSPHTSEAPPPRAAQTTHPDSNLTVVEVEPILHSHEASSETNRAMTLIFIREMDTIYVAD